MPASTNPPRVDPMRVVTWNIQFGLEVARAADELAALEQSRPIDILLLQEMDEPGTAAIAERLGASYAYRCAAPHAKTGRDFGNAVVSRWPIVESREIALPYQAPVQGQPRSATHAVVDVDGTTMSAYSVHTEVPSLPLRQRRAQFDTLAADIERQATGPVVVGGDFNTVTERGVTALDRSMARAGLQRVSGSVGHSYRRLGRAMSLDHVFVAGLRVEAIGTMSDATASDHVPLWLDLMH